MELNNNRAEHEKQRDLVVNQVKEAQVAIDDKRKELALIEQNIENKSDKIAEKQVIEDTLAGHLFGFLTVA